MASVRIGLIGGSGLGEALASEGGERRAVDTPFGPPSSPLLHTQWEGCDLVILQRHGDGHVLNPSAVPYRANIYALKAAGVTHIVASGATGSLREEIQPRDLVIVDQVIDKTCKRPNTFYEHAAVHVEFAQPFCPIVRQWLLQAAEQIPDLTVHPAGTYVCMEGPAFSTRAESLLHRDWGGDLIGMTAMPEARLAREAEIAYGMVALPTDHDCWKTRDQATDPEQLLSEIIANMQTATTNSLALIRQALRDTTMLQSTPSPAHDALAMAIWSDKSRIPREQVQRLAVLWGRHF
ncbi:MAG: S-methyl-5'-thioadenosine phosphorylase [Phycisphaerae bacterium]|nr:S-methyl-5'-thioadenosine phosphorylase [Phycisphaerae bacterium]